MPPTKHRTPRRAPPSPLLHPHRGPSPGAPPEVDPVWLVKALGVTLIAALFCAWLTVCLLFYQGEWQLILRPTRTFGGDSGQTPASAGLPFEQVRFDPGDSGQPRLTAWWVRAEPGARYAAYTILYLHDGSLSLSATVPALFRLHKAGLNVFALDYRGFGESDASAHPTEVRMAEDSAAALGYLTGIRHLPARSIVPYGTGLGGSLAVKLAQAHPEMLAVIVDNPDPDPTATAVAARPSHIIPVRLLFRERFDIRTPLATLTTPKLLIAGGPNSRGAGDLRALQALFRKACSPAFTVFLPAVHYDDNLQATLSRFLDQYLRLNPS